MNQKTPAWMKWTMALSLLNSWVLFEEVVVDRSSLWRYMPYYLVGRVCPWDATVFVVVACRARVESGARATRPHLRCPDADR